MRQYFMLYVAATLVAACSTESDTVTTQEIGSSIEVGENLDQTAPYGFPMYPGATVKVRMLSGSGMLINSDSTADDIANFYSQELKKRGYQAVEIERKNEKISISGVSSEDPDWRLIVSVQPRKESDGQYILIFAKLGTP